MIPHYPHCDQRVLHAPNECQYCDRHPDWQELRQVWGIAFSGHEPGPDQVFCPADRAVLARQRGDYNRWGGNIPRPAGCPECGCSSGHEVTCSRRGT